MYSFASGFLYLTKCSWDLFMLLHVSVTVTLLPTSSPLYEIPGLFVFLSHSPADGHLKYFQILAMTNKASINTFVQVRVCVWSSVLISRG